MKPRGVGPVAANTVVIGVVTVLVLVVGVFIAYNANKGLPFVPTYNIKAEVPDASGLVPNNDVKIAGFRVGFVKDINTVSHPDGSYTAELSLKLEERVKPVYKNARVMVRQSSTLGLKYLDLETGTQSAGELKEGEGLSIENSTRPVEVQDFFNTFDKETRDNLRITLRGLGGTFAGRGLDLNRALETLPSLMRNLEPVVETLAGPDTELEQFVINLGATAEQIAPVAQSFAGLFVNLDVTFAALAQVKDDMQRTLERAPSSFAVSTEAMPAIRPFLRRATELSAELRPSIRNLRRAAPHLADTVTAGKGLLPRAPAFNRRLVTNLRKVEQLVEDGNVSLAIDKLREMSDALNPFLGFVAPAQTTCNYVTLLFRNAASFLSEGSPGITNWQRVVPIIPAMGPNNLMFPSSGPAAGPDPGNYLHSNPYPNTAAPGQDRECEAGRETYADSQVVIGNVGGNQGVVTEGR